MHVLTTMSVLIAVHEYPHPPTHAPNQEKQMDEQRKGEDQYHLPIIIKNYHDLSLFQRCRSS